MENLGEIDIVKCRFNKNHLICQPPVMVLKCDEKEIGLACLRCVKQQTDYAGTFSCPMCHADHKITSLPTMDSSPKEFAEYKAKLDLHSESRLKSLLQKYNHVKNELTERTLAKNRTYVTDYLFEFIEHDMLVRVESLKIELERAEMTLWAKLDKTRRIRASRLAASAHHLDTLVERMRSQAFNPSPDQTTTTQKAHFINDIQTMIKNVKFLQLKIDATRVDNNNDDKNTTPSKTLSTPTDFKSYAHLIRFVKQIDSQNLVENYLKSEQKKAAAPRAFSKRKNCLSTGRNSTNSTMSRSLIGYLHARVAPIAFDTRFSATSQLLLSVKVVDLSRHLKSACGLAEIFTPTTTRKYQLIVSDYAADTVNYFRHYDVHLADESELVRSVARFKAVKVKKFYAVCSDLDDNGANSTLADHNLYVCDMELHRVLIFDYEMTRLKRIVHGTKSHIAHEDDEFDCPRDICYSARLVYVLDQGKRVVNVFARDGDHVKDLDYVAASASAIANAWSVRVNVDTMAIVDWREAVYLFDLGMRLKGVVRFAQVTSACLVSDWAWQRGSEARCLRLVVHAESGDLGVYVVCGGKEPVLVLNRNFKALRCGSEFMMYTSDHKIVLTLGWSKSIALID